MQPEAEARSVLGPTARFLAAGATCEVYTDGERVLRLAHGPEARLSSQASVMRALSAAGVPVPEVLEVGWLPSGRAFSLESFVAGDDAGPSREGWADLGRALGVLHVLPHAGFGVLVDRGGDFQGVASTPADGLRTRLKAWPLNGGRLSAQPLIHHAPDLAPPLAALEPELGQVTETPSALCHTDLHAGQFRWQAGRLWALLDFGDAAIGPPAWDVASVAYFHGWNAAELVAEAASLRCDRNAALLGVLLAFHRAGRAAEQGRPQRLAEAAAFARSCLDRLG
ncbi:aminoglycoside phosphotransferase family protein [Deinococcus marmoris]|uniref:aminoglycoside phosphotransferase family protein n=1 Tax=Deinococcus marmoris TaxID=249408 RepID=UPI0004951BDE|nr:aminoglycoside phosphotransferase family protein [Deinococcus marmoris]